MMMRTSTRRYLTLAALAGLFLVGTAVGVAAFNPQPEPPGKWALGITPDQEASLTAVNLASRGECEVTFEYRDAGGRTLVSDTMMVPPGGFASLNFSPPPDGTTPARTQIRGVVTPLSSSCELATTLEIFDPATGQTAVAIGDA